MNYRFVYDEKLELETPIFLVPIDHWSEREKNAFYEKAKKISEKIPEKIRKLDETYMRKYETLHEQPDLFFEKMEELNEISSKISALNAIYFAIEGKHLRQT